MRIKEEGGAGPFIGIPNGDFMGSKRLVQGQGSVGSEGSWECCGLGQGGIALE